MRKRSLRPDLRPLIWRGLVTAVCLALILALLPIDEAIGAARRVGGRRWVTILAVLSLLQLAAAAKWRLLMAAAGERCRFPDLLRAHGAGLLANNFLPSLVGGDVLRAGILARRGVRSDALLVSGLTDRAADAAALVVIAAGAGLFGPLGMDARFWRPLTTVSAILVVGLAAGGLLLNWLTRSRMPFGIPAIASKVRTAGRALLARPGAGLSALCISLVIQSSLVALNVWLAQAMGLSLPVAAWLVVWPLGKLLAAVPISLGGLGVRQVAMAGLLAPLAVEPGLAMAQSLVWESLLLGLGVVGGTASILLPGARSLSIAEKVPD